MGTNMCCGCKENYRETEVAVDNNTKVLKLIRNTTINNNKFTNSITNLNVDQKLLDIITNQLDYGSNPQVRALEATYGPFYPTVPFSDSLPTIVVGPLSQENSAIYYGQWFAYFHYM